MNDDERSAEPGQRVRRAGDEDATEIGRLLHDFNTEFDSPTPGPDAMAERSAELIAAGAITVFLVGDGPDGIAVVRVRPALWSQANETYLEELYVAPSRRGQGLGRALMEAVLADARERGCDRIDLGTEEDDTAARGLYESLGFSNREGGPEGPLMFFYEREL